MKKYGHMIGLASIVVFLMVLSVNTIQIDVTWALAIFTALALIALIIPKLKIAHKLENLEHLLMFLVFLAFIYAGFTLLG
ncbi:hypothetical protein [Methanococcus voltae]|uniref:Uncharacterized membrane protein YhaH (DUF805 family) n=2 Tax=Methanococcus voltae TaxID=2188 RepID=A0A8J7S5F6_METVO|nr:hypothetical protein [Methanococcus voltae]MBP2172867.1 uncharacterized membrane protein YhaH (DUF805 family) [Methanococcus voltae]MBP2201723.1 uncharacterized membrane protein YhaH (DUF805 family) [Methanococcus voltae]MCS3922511.1 uncharacterized membrane protein YhaH (DUF805 family) [Methanococcus voltae PS]